MYVHTHKRTYIHTYIYKTYIHTYVHFSTRTRTSQVRYWTFRTTTLTSGALT